MTRKMYGTISLPLWCLAYNGNSSNNQKQGAAAWGLAPLTPRPRAHRRHSRNQSSQCHPLRCHRDAHAPARAAPARHQTLSPEWEAGGGAGGGHGRPPRPGPAGPAGSSPRCEAVVPLGLPDPEQSCPQLLRPPNVPCTSTRPWGQWPPKPARVREPRESPGRCDRRWGPRLAVPRGVLTPGAGAAPHCGGGGVTGAGCCAGRPGGTSVTCVGDRPRQERAPLFPDFHQPCGRQDGGAPSGPRGRGASSRHELRGGLIRPA